MHAVKVKLKKKKNGGGIIIYPHAGGKCHIWTGTIYHITRGACVSARQGCLVDLQNSSSKLAMPRKKRTSVDNDCEIRKWEAGAMQMTGQVMCKSQDELHIKT